MATLIRIDRNGSKYYEGMVTCDRCGGQGGSDQWQYTGWTCYKCGGTGWIAGKWIERTPEYEAKLAERRAARHKKYVEEHAEEIKERQLALEMWKAEKERQEALEKARKEISQYVGEIGEKLELNAMYVKKAWFDFRGPFGKEERMFVHTFKDSDGNLLVWKTSSSSLPDISEGNPVEIKGTVKEHSEYKEEKQTILTRCKVKLH